MALDTVTKLVSAARVLLQDTVVTYRYADADLLLAMNAGLLEVRRLRPDLFLAAGDAAFSSVPDYTVVDTTAVTLDQQYRLALLYFMVGYAQLRDEEDVTDARAASLFKSFTARLLSDELTVTS